MIKAFFLVGPTAIGKTAVCQFIAEKHGFEILSADAMLVYRGMDIGTAKPDADLRSRVRYFGMDLVEAHEHFSVGIYREHAIAALRRAAGAGRRMIVTGGTGLYVKGLTHGLDEQPPHDQKTRNEAEEIMRQGGIEALQKWAESQAAGLYAAIGDKKNPRRLVRAVEIARATAVAGTSWRDLGRGPEIPGLAMPMPQLHERINRRVEAMYAGGLLDEVASLLKSGLESSPTAVKAIGYAEAIAVLRGTLTIKEAIAGTSARTRQLAKRQMTWFRNQANVEWLQITPEMPVEAIAQTVMNCWTRNGPTPIAE